MNRELKIDWRDWETRKIKSHGMWILVGKDVNMHDLETGKVVGVEVSQLLNGKYIVERVIKEGE